MNCSKCGNKINEDMKFCNKCGNKISEGNTQEENINNEKIKVNVADVVNKKSVANSTNRVAYIANAWALQIRNRGTTFAIIIGIIYFFMAMDAFSNINDSSVDVFFSTFGMGLLYAIIIVAVFNTTAFIIRMGAEVIQLLDDIKKNNAKEKSSNEI